VLERLMKDASLSKSALARKLNVSPQVVSNWFSRGAVPPENFSTIAEVFGCSVDELTGRSPPRGGKATPVIPPRSVEAARFAAEWDKLEDPLRTQIKIMVEALVTHQIDLERRSNKKPPKGGDQPRST
jgi:transcriptional regulator with XRE-family HTH domain